MRLVAGRALIEGRGVAPIVLATGVFNVHAGLECASCDFAQPPEAVMEALCEA